MILITKLDKCGQPITAKCPEHGEVEIINMPSQGTGSLKRISRAKAAGGKINHGNGPKQGQLSCGCTFKKEDINNNLSEQFNYVCRLIELANDISFENRYELTTDDNHDNFAMRMFNLFRDFVVDAGYCNEIKFDKEFEGLEYNMIIKEFEGIEKYLSSCANYKIGDNNIISKYYFKPEKQDLPEEYTWDAFFTIKPDGSPEVADYLIKWCEHNDIEIDLGGDETPEEIANHCVKRMYS